MPDLRHSLQTAVGTKYRVTRELTGGGMSRVFLSEDTTLEREVVIKVLSPDLLDETRVERFRQEVLHTARLQHPTIVQLLEVGTLTDVSGRHVPYYVMPYVRGESLRSRLRHEGRLSAGVTIKVLRGVLDALVHAHAHGVIHRDIKPENVFLSGTTTVLADFGIAKAIAGPGSQGSATAEGMAVGTPAYMAPEQLVAQGNVDHRADLYAVGVVGYEMLVGDLPFGGRDQSTVDKLKRHVRGKLTPIRDVRPDASSELADIIEACLAWDAKDRPESAEKVLRVLEAIPITPSTETYRVPTIAPLQLVRRRPLAVAGVLAAAALALTAIALNPFGPKPASDRTIAVLYPELGTGDTDRTFRDQLYQMLVGTLNPIAGVRVAGNVSVAQMLGQGFSTQQIRDSLRAEGFDSALVIRSRPSSSGGHLLSLELQRLAVPASAELVGGPVSLSSIRGMAPDSVRSLVRSLAGQAVAKLRLSSTSSAVPLLVTVDAWSAWSRGRDAYAKRTPAGLGAAVAHFEKAIALDSTYAQAYADLAQTLALSLFYKYARAETPYEIAARALRLAERAIELQPGLGEGHLARGYLGSVAGAPIEFLERNYGEAKRLSATNPYSRTWYVALLGARGEYDEAVDILQEEVRLDPRSPAQRVALALYALPGKRHLVAMREATTARKLVANIPLTAQLELLARLQLGGRLAEDCATVPSGPYLGTRAMCLDRLGRREEARVVADSLFAIIADRAPRDTSFDLSLYLMELSTYHAARKEPDAARQWLRQAMLESPAAIDVRVIRSGYFDGSLLAFGDSLRAGAWKRVSQMAERANRDRRPVN
jgi:eukaryotic-like serine/threonine-protein kinase